jgi:hypothetical protein
MHVVLVLVASKYSRKYIVRTTVIILQNNTAKEAQA